MAQLKVLSAIEIDSLFSHPQTCFFFMQEKKRLRNEKFDAIGIFDRTQTHSFLSRYFKGDTDKALSYNPVPISFQSPAHLYDFFTKCNIKRICFVDKGIITIDDSHTAMQISDVKNAMKYKLDNEYFYWIGFSDGRLYLKDDALCLYLNLHEARHVAEQLGGHLGSFTVIAPVLTNCIKEDATYFVNNMFIKGYVFKSACIQHFNDSKLPFDTIKSYIDKGLSIFAGQNDWDEFELFVNQGMSTVFSEGADLNLIHPLIQQTFPDDSQFFPVQKRELLYEFVTTKNVSIDCKYHCDRDLFENAIMGRNDYKTYSLEEKQTRIKQLFDKTYLYVILSREEYKEKLHSSYPSVINSTRRKVWIFDDYGKALTFCQRKERFVAEGVPAIGLITSAKTGWDLHSILSLLLTWNVEDVELNPLEDDRMLLPIQFILSAHNLPVLRKDQIQRIQLDKSDNTNDNPWVFNDIVLA